MFSSCGRAAAASSALAEDYDVMEEERGLLAEEAEETGEGAVGSVRDETCEEVENDDASLMDRGDRRKTRGRSRSRSRSRLPRSSHTAAPKARNENCRRSERVTSRLGHSGGAASGAGSSTDRPNRATVERVSCAGTPRRRSCSTGSPTSGGGAPEH